MKETSEQKSSPELALRAETNNTPVGGLDNSQESTDVNRGFIFNDDDEPGSKPELEIVDGELLVSGNYTISLEHTGYTLYSKLEGTKEFFLRGGEVCRVIDGKFKPVEPHELRSIAGKHLTVLAVNFDKDKNEFVKKPVILTADLAAALLANDAKTELPAIAAISEAPVVYEHPDKPGSAKVSKTYTDKIPGGVYITGGAWDNIDSLEDAVDLILGLFSDFDFATESDKSRAIANLLTPALVQGGLVSGSIPIDFGEADKSQSGKGYRHKIVCSVYNAKPTMISQNIGGVGSLDEKIGGALLDGRQFIRLDNIRARIDSPQLEAIITAGDDYILARGFRREGQVKSNKFIFQASSNGAESTVDLANRSCVVRIRKRPAGYQFREYPEGDLLDHVISTQGKYLGAVHRVVGEWIKAGKPRSNETRHDFRDWARKLDWILTNYFKRPGMLDGHREIQDRVSSPIISLLRQIALEVSKSGKLDESMTASELVDVAESTGYEFKCSGRDNEAKARWLGIQLGKVYADEARIGVDGFTIERIINREKRFDGEGYMDKKYYRFSMG